MFTTLDFFEERLEEMVDEYRFSDSAFQRHDPSGWLNDTEYSIDFLNEQEGAVV